ncbi:MAG: sigma-70 family RNA polymerase sigma factor [Candidatus Gottesmanbacteria bacterium]
MNDRQLIKKVLDKDQKAIKEFYKLYSPSLFNLISAKIDRREDVEELLQDTWISILDSLPLFNFQSSFLTWAKSIAFHEVADFYRKRKIKSLIFSHLPFLENLVSEALGPDIKYQQQEIKQEIDVVLKHLSEGYSEIIRLKYIEGHSMAQIGYKLSISIKAVESKLSRARIAFQKEWQRNYPYALSVSSPLLA